MGVDVMTIETLVNQPKTKRGKVTLQCILDAAAQVFYEKGYHGSSINDICQLASIASGTFYIYFDSKYNLYKFMLLQVSRMIRKSMSRAIKDCTSRREAERVGLKAWLDFTRKNPYMYHIIWESLYIDKQLFVDYYVNFCAAYSRRLIPAKESGEVRDIDTEVLSYVLMGASNFLGLNWGLFKEHENPDLDYVVDEFMKIIDNGIFTEKGLHEPDHAAGGKAAKPKLPRFRIELDD